MRIDDSRERRLVGLGADIGVGDPNQLITGDAWLAVAMRVSPRFVASARMAASNAFSLSQASPVRRLVKAAEKRVRRLTSCSSSVMRTLPGPGH